MRRAVVRRHPGRRTADPWPGWRSGAGRLGAGVVALLLSGTAGCDGGRPPPAAAVIAIDMDAIDADGLRGTAAGKVAVSYEFAIPDTPAMRDTIRRIDRSIEFMPGSRGRIGAAPGQCLCIGSTHQPGWREVLGRLAALPGVTPIIECHHE